MIIVLLIVLGVCLGSFINAFVWRFRRQAEIKYSAFPATERAQETTKTFSCHKNHPTTEASGSEDGIHPTSDVEKLSISKGHSMCSQCGHPLAAKDLVPVVSYMLLRGRCRYCRNPIHDTPAPEIITPLLFVLSYIYWPLSFVSSSGHINPLAAVTFGLWLVFLVGFVILGLYDYYWHELPHDIVFPLICLAVVQSVVVAVIFGGGTNSILHALYGAVVCSGVFVLLYWISPKSESDTPAAAVSDITPAKIGIGTLVFGIMLGWMFGDKDSKWIGGGDITLGILLGILVGGPANALFLIFIASLIGTLLAIPMLLAGKATRTTHLPFGPMLLSAAVIITLFGESLLAWYKVLFIV